MAEATLLVRDLMSTRIVSIEPDATIAEAQSRMEQNNVHELPVMVKNDLKGWISYRTLLRQGNVSAQAKVSTVMETPSRLREEIDIYEAADVLIRQSRAAVPVENAKGELVGILSRTDVLKAAANVPRLAKQPIEKFMTIDLQTVAEDELLDRAINRMRDHGINTLLVTDANGRLAGHVSFETLLRARQAEHSPSSDGATQRGSGERRRPRVSVKGFVTAAPTVTPSTTLKEAVDAMTKNGTRFVAAVEDGYAVGVVARSNVVEQLARLRPEKGVLCQIVGLGDYVDADIMEHIYSLAQDSLQKIQNEVTIEFLSLHYKVYKAKTVGDSKYSLSAHLSTEGRFFVQKADAWDPIDVTRDALDHLELQVNDQRERRLEKRKTAGTRGATFYTATRA